MSTLSRRIVFAASTAVALQFLAQPVSAAVLPVISVGWTPNDLDPYNTATPAANWGYASPIALDYAHRSFVADLGSVKHFTAVEIDQTGTTSRLNSRDLALFVSNDDTTYQKVATDFIDFSGRVALRVTAPAGSNARYVKVHCCREGGTFTCVANNLQTAFRVLDQTFKEFTGSGGGVWTYRTPIVISNTNATALADRTAFLAFTTLGAPALIAAGKLRSDYADLRFADDEDRELHGYANANGVYIRIPFIAANSTKTIYAYSGNPSAENRVTRDVDALQVQYGTRTIQELGVGLTKIVQLGGTLLAKTEVAGTSIKARYSTNGGRTWGAIETFLAPSIAGAVSVAAEGSLWDNGKLTFVFYARFRSDFAKDMTDPAYNYLQTYVVQATSFTASGRPIWGTPQRIPTINRTTGAEAAYVLTYTNPIKTSSGAYLFPLAYMVHSSGTFATSVFRSTDGGLSWVQSPDEFVSSQNGFECGISEAGLAQLPNGSIRFVGRQQVGAKYVFAEATSTDDGINWTVPADSNILASNTQPQLFDAQTPNSTALVWPGHNAFSQTSYFRNNLTAAYSDDNATSWNGYHDLLAGSEFSLPGWFSASFLNVVNCESKPSGSNDRLFGWVNGDNNGATVMVVEDFEQYIRGSHGAMDAPTFRDTAKVANGAELADSFWWRSTPNGTLDIVAGQRPGRQAIRIQSGAGFPGYASRLFPGIKKGVFRCAFKVSAIGSGIWISLQEGYSNSPTARRAALTLYVTSTGELRRVSAPNTEIRGDIGHRENDTNPAIGRQAAFGQFADLAYDYQSRSVGADLYSPRPVNSIILVDDESLSTPGDRIDPATLQVWKSSDNETWTQVTGWLRSQSANKIYLSGPTFTTRYVKVCQPFADSAWTFGNSKPKLMEVRPFLGTAPTTVALDIPTFLTVGAWNLMQVTVDATANTATVRINGTDVETCSLLEPGLVLTHLLLGADSTGSVSSVSLDELVVIDTSKGQPAVQSVGATVGI